MANKTSVSTEVRHAMVDIEFGIDVGISAKVQEKKDEYNESVKEVKESRDASIKQIRSEKRALMKEALENLVADEEA